MDLNDNKESLSQSVKKRINAEMLSLQQKTSLPISSSVPSRFKEGSFRRFEPILVAYLAHYPDPLIFQPKGLSIATTTARIRDAVLAVQRNPHWVKSWFLDALKTHWPNTDVTDDGKSVRIGPPQKQKILPDSFEYIETASAKVSGNTFILDTCSGEILYATCTLLNLLSGSGQFRLLNTTLNETMQLILDDFPNVEAFQDGADVILL